MPHAVWDLQSLNRGICLRMVLWTDDQIPMRVSNLSLSLRPHKPVVTVGAKAGIISTPSFTNSSAGADFVASNGEWLNVPDAVLFSNSGSNNQAILLSLQNPLYNKDEKVGTTNPHALYHHIRNPDKRSTKQKCLFSASL